MSISLFFKTLAVGILAIQGGVSTKAPIKDHASDDTDIRMSTIFQDRVPHIAALRLRLIEGTLPKDLCYLLGNQDTANDGIFVVEYWPCKEGTIFPSSGLEDILNLEKGFSGVVYKCTDKMSAIYSQTKKRLEHFKICSLAIDRVKKVILSITKGLESDL